MREPGTKIVACIDGCICAVFHCAYMCLYSICVCVSLYIAKGINGIVLYKK